MVLVCSNCNARLQLEDAKAPAAPFTVRCPKCQTTVNVPAPPNPSADPATPHLHSENNTEPAGFTKPPSAPRFSDANGFRQTAADDAPHLDDIARLLVDAMRGNERSNNPRRTAENHRKALVCCSPAYRETISDALATNQYEVFVAENIAQALGKLREEHMDVLVLDADFDPIEQGVAFITREISLMRPSRRRRLFFVYVTATARTMDLHAAFLHNVNLVVNPSDIEQFPDALDVSIRQYNELYKPMFRALDVASI